MFIATPCQLGRGTLSFAAILVALAVACDNSRDEPTLSRTATLTDSSDASETYQELVDSSAGESQRKENPTAQDAAASFTEEQRFGAERARMVVEQLAARDISNQRVLDAMSQIPRHKFVPAHEQRMAYVDSPRPIGHEQTISQPYIVALMTQLVAPQPTSKALDVGTGSGYQAAVLAELVKNVYSIEIIEPLANQARTRLESLGYKNIHVRHGDGYRGWPEKAPFDIIIVAAAPDHVPQPLVDQLAPGGTMVIPVGEWYQKLLLIQKAKDGKVTRNSVAPVSFVPMTGEAQSKAGEAFALCARFLVPARGRPASRRRECPVG